MRTHQTGNMMKEHISSSLPTNFLNVVNLLIPENRRFTDPMSTLAYGTDASFYRLIPKLVVRVESEEEVITILATAYKEKVAVTFRAAGTSLSGQASTDSVLIVLGDNWNGKDIRNEGEQIRLQPGVIGAHANKWLLPYGKKIGPDPASIDTCKIGGILANNASGMCCGTSQNSYKTIADIRVVLADGAVLDTEKPESVEAFKQTHQQLMAGLTDLAKETRANTILADKIRHKYRLKNTTGLSINALVDFDDPIEILKHIMVGSEGILGFISAVTYNTVPELPFKASAFVVFPDIETCCKAVPILKQQPVSAVEMLDRRSMRSVENKPGLPEWVKTLSTNACALLIESRATSPSLLNEQLTQIMDVLKPFPVEQKIDFTQNPAEYSKLWAIRKDIFPAVGGVRKTGTTVIIEDVTFPVERLAEGANRLLELFDKHHYDEAILFGHALEGNLHFVFTQGFDDPEQVARYSAFMEDVTNLVAVDFGGSLKAEHGTGRNMAPFVELEWGTEAWQLMWKIKKLFDPQHILNPDVVLSDNKQLHLQNLKPLPAADPLVDRCMECGFCEPVCPSKNLTLSPRQRIVMWRDILAKKAAGHDITELMKRYQYYGVDTCAATGLCSIRCPLDINTGALIKQLRINTAVHTKTAQWMSGHFATALKGVRFTLCVASKAQGILGTPMMENITQGLRKLTFNHLPRWSPAMPTAAEPLRFVPSSARPSDKPRVVYFTTCVSRMMGPAVKDIGQVQLVEKTKNLLEKAGYQVVLPEWVNDLCCGQSFESKGYPTQAETKSTELIQALLKASRNGQDPIYMDTSSCSLRTLEAIKQQGVNLSIYDSVEFIHKFLMERLEFNPIDEDIALHITCSSQHLAQSQAFLDIVRSCTTKQVVIPENIHCCAFAGDKGFNVPELNAHSLRTLKETVKHCKEGVSNSRTCEIGLTEHSGMNYRSIVYLVDKVTSAKQYIEVNQDVAENSH